MCVSNTWLRRRKEAPFINKPGGERSLNYCSGDGALISPLFPRYCSRDVSTTALKAELEVVSDGSRKVSGCLPSQCVSLFYVDRGRGVTDGKDVLNLGESRGDEWRAVSRHKASVCVSPRSAQRALSPLTDTNHQLVNSCCSRSEDRVEGE